MHPSLYFGRLDRLSQSWERFKTFQLPIPALTAPIISSLISGHHITANVFLKALETSGWCQSVLTAQLHIFYIIFCQWKLSLPLVVASAHSESHLFYLCSLRVFGPNWYFLTNHWAHSYTKASMQYLLWSSGTQGFVITEATPAHRSLHTQKVIRNLGCRMRSSAAESSSTPEKFTFFSVFTVRNDKNMVSSCELYLKKLSIIHSLEKKHSYLLLPDHSKMNAWRGI